MTTLDCRTVIGGDRDGNNGLDADELAAFMRHLDLDLSLGEAMLASSKGFCVVSC